MYLWKAWIFYYLNPPNPNDEKYHVFFKASLIQHFLFSFFPYHLFSTTWCNCPNEIMSRDPNCCVQSFPVCGQTMLEQVGAKYCDLTAPSILLNINKSFSSLLPELLILRLGQEWLVSKASISGLDNWCVSPRSQWGVTITI